MTAYNKFTRGSEWRIWDLHIHTQGTKKNDQFTGATLDEKWLNYVASINNSTEEISVIGITDYFSIENYYKFKHLVANGEITKSCDLLECSLFHALHILMDHFKRIKNHGLGGLDSWERGTWSRS